MKTLFGLFVMVIGGYIFQSGYKLCDEKTRREFSEKLYKSLKEAR